MLKDLQLTRDDNKLAIPFAKLFFLQPFLNFSRWWRGGDENFRSLDDVQMFLSLVENLQNTFQLFLDRRYRPNRVWLLWNKRNKRKIIKKYTKQITVAGKSILNVVMMVPHVKLMSNYRLGCLLSKKHNQHLTNSQFQFKYCGRGVGGCKNHSMLGVSSM